MVEDKKTNMKILVYYVNSHQKVTSAKKDFYDQVDLIMCSVDSRKPFSWLSLSALWAYRQS